MSKGRYFCGGSALAVTLALTMGANQASAQNNVTTVQEVVSTGTLIQGVGEDAALSVETTSREDLLNRGSPSAAGFVAGLSEVGLQGGASARGRGGTQDGVQTINLRGMGAGRTLVLVNGVRLADDPTSQGGDVNLTGGPVQNINSIPMEVLSQVEVLKDGGGATYGSDAASGAVNFVTRRDLNGFEAAANYTYVADTDGKYDLNIQWGKRSDSGNLLVSLFYSHSSPLAAEDRDFTRRSFAQNSALSGGNSPWQSGVGTYVFARPSPNATNTSTTFQTNVAQYNGFIPIITQSRRDSPAANVLVGTTVVAYTDQYGTNSTYGLSDPVFGVNGEVRNDACVQLGGFAGFSGANATPICYYRLSDTENITDETDTYRVFTDLNYDVTDSLRLHSSLTFSKTNTFIEGRELGANTACDPWPTNAQSYATRTSNGTATFSRQCNMPGYLTGGTTTAVSSALSVPGYNPAVRDYVLRYSDTNNARVFSDAEINALTGCNGCNTTQFNGGTRNFATPYLGQAYAPVGAPGSATPYQAGAYGRVFLTDYSPFVAMYNTAYGEAGENFYQNQSSSLSIVQELKGDLGEKLGNFVDFTARATYNRQQTTQEGPGLLTDRLQRALNGFASNMDDLGPGRDGCTVAETSGVRRVRVDQTYGTGTNLTVPPGGNYVTISGVPYTVGAGGGTDYDPTTPGVQSAQFGFVPTTAALGNGCFFFNPFASAIRVSRLNGAQIEATSTQVGFVGADTLAYGEGSSGDYQGYADGYGLENAPGILRWLFAPMRTISQSDNINLELIFNGSLSNYKLPGGDISWAVFGNYRYNLRTADSNGLLDRVRHPCTFLKTLTNQGSGGTAGAIGFAVQNEAADSLVPTENLSNDTSTCGTQANTGASGLVSLITGMTPPNGQGLREQITHAIGGELNLPVLDNLNVHLAARYDEQKGAGATFFSGGTVFSGDIKWQATNNFAFTARVSQTFDAPVLDAAGENLTTTFPITVAAPITALYSGTGLNPQTRRYQVGNTDLGPETGLNWGGGVIFTTDDRRSTIRADYFNNTVSGRAQQFAGAALTRVMTKNPVPNTATDTQAIIDCNDPNVQRLFDPAQAPAIFGGRPYAEWENARGDRARGCYSVGDQIFDSNRNQTVTLTVGAMVRGIQVTSGIDQNGVAGPDDRITLATNEIVEDIADPEDYGLVLLMPSRVNAGDLKTSGVDLTGSHTFANNIFGGQVTLGADVTWVLTNSQAATEFAGVQLQLAQDFIGTQSSTPGTGPGGGATANISARAVIWNGSASVNYRRGNNNFYLEGRYNGPAADNSTLGSTLAQIPPISTANLNPPDPTTCNALNNGLGLPYSPQPANIASIENTLGSFGTGEQAYNANCNLTNTTGNYLSGQFVLNASFRTTLPWDTQLSVSVNNLLDTAPPFQVYEFNYNPFANLSPEGRTVTVGLRKRF